MFNFKNVQYGEILHIPNLVIKAKEITCILGESGSGKTTLLRLLNKLSSPTQGRIYFNGEDIDEINSIDLRRKIVMLPQLPVVFPGTLKDNLLIGLEFAGMNIVADEVLEEVLIKVQLKINLNMNADKLSGGEKQRLALARVLLLNPEVFLLDEPSSALDKDTEKAIINMMVEHVKYRNKTLIMVTHSREVAYEVADTVVSLSNGRLLEQGG